MKNIFAYLLILSLSANAQKDTVVSKYFTPMPWDTTDNGWRCGVAHWTKDGIFQCDFKDTYYPDQIFDTTVTKWFIHMYCGDSLFYYRHYETWLYVWNGRPKNEMFGYEHRFVGGGSITIPDKYMGKDTLIDRHEYWTPFK
jgi:hypothetical protein